MAKHAGSKEWRLFRQPRATSHLVRVSHKAFTGAGPRRYSPRTGHPLTGTARLPQAAGVGKHGRRMKDGS